MDLKRVSSKEPKKAVNLKFKTHELVHPDTPRNPGRCTPAPDINDDDSGCCESLPIECRRIKNKPTPDEASSSQAILPQSNGLESNDFADDAPPQTVRQTAGGGRTRSQPMNVRSSEQISSASCERALETPSDSPHQSKSTASFLKHSSTRIENPPAENATTIKKQLENSSYGYPRGEAKFDSAQKEKSNSEEPSQDVSNTIQYPVRMRTSSVMQRHKQFPQTTAPMPELPPQLQLEPSSFPIIPPLPAPMMKTPPPSPIAPPPKSPNVQHPNVPENPPSPRLEKEHARLAAKSPYPQPPTKSPSPSTILSPPPQNNRPCKSPGPNSYHSRSVTPNYFPPVSPASFYPVSPKRPPSRPGSSQALYPPPHSLRGAPSPVRPPSVMDGSHMNYEPMMFPISGPQSLGTSPQHWSPQSPGSFASYGNSPSYPFSDPYGGPNSMSNIMSPDIGRLSRASSGDEDPNSFNSHHYNEDQGGDKNIKLSGQSLSPYPADNWGGDSDFGNCVETVRRWRQLASDFRSRSPPSGPNPEWNRANSPSNFVPVSAPSERGPESTRIWFCDKDQKSKEVTALNYKGITEFSAGDKYGMNYPQNAVYPNPTYANNSSVGGNRMWNDQSMPSHWTKMPGIRSHERSPGEWRQDQYPSNKPTEQRGHEMYPNRADAPGLFDFDMMPSTSVPHPQFSNATLGMSAIAPNTSCDLSSFSYPPPKQWMDDSEKSSNRVASPSCQSPRFAAYPPPKSCSNATDTNVYLQQRSMIPTCKSPDFSTYPSPKECLESNEISSAEPDSPRSTCKSPGFPAYPPPPKQKSDQNEQLNDAQDSHWDEFRQSTQLVNDGTQAGSQSYEKSDPSFVSGKESSRSEGRPTSTGFRFDTDDRGIRVDSPPIVCTPRAVQDQRSNLVKPTIISQNSLNPESNATSTPKDKPWTTKNEQNEQQLRDSQGKVMIATNGDSEMQTSIAKPADSNQEVIHQENEEVSLPTYPPKTQCQQPMFYQTPLQQTLQQEQRMIHKECPNQLEMEYEKKIREIGQRKQSEKENSQISQDESPENAHGEIPSGRKTPYEREFKMPDKNTPMLRAQQNQQPQIYQCYPQQHWQQRQMQQQQWQMQQQFRDFQRPQFNQYPQFQQPELQKKQQSDQFEQPQCKPQRSRQSLLGEKEMQLHEQQKPLQQAERKLRHQEEQPEQKRITNHQQHQYDIIQQNPEEQIGQQDELGQHSRTSEKQKEQEKQFQENRNKQRPEQKGQDFQEQSQPFQQQQAFQQPPFYQTKQEAFNQQPYNQLQYHQSTCRQQPHLQQTFQQHEFQQFQQQQFPQSQIQNQFENSDSQPMATNPPGINKHDDPMCVGDLMKGDLKEKENEILKANASYSNKMNRSMENQDVQDQNETQKNSYNKKLSPALDQFPPQTPHWYNFPQQQQFQQFQAPKQNAIHQSMQQVTEKETQVPRQQLTLQPAQFRTSQQMQLCQEQIECPSQQQIKFPPPLLQNFSVPEDQEKHQPMHFPLQDQFEVSEEKLKNLQEVTVQHPSQQWHPTQEQMKSTQQQHHLPQEPISSPRQQMHCSIQQQLRIPQESFKYSPRQMQNFDQQQREYPQESLNNSQSSAQHQQFHHAQEQFKSPRPQVQYPSHQQHSHESSKSPTQEMHFQRIQQLQQPPCEKLNSPWPTVVPLQQLLPSQQQQTTHFLPVQQNQQSEEQMRSPHQQAHFKEQQKLQNIENESHGQEMQYQPHELQQQHSSPKQQHVEQVEVKQQQYCQPLQLQQQTQILKAYNGHQNEKNETTNYWGSQGTSASPLSHGEIKNERSDPRPTSESSGSIKDKTILVQRDSVELANNYPVSNKVMSGDQDQYIPNFSSREPQILVKERIDTNDQSKSAETFTEARLQSLRKNLLAEFLVPKAAAVANEKKFTQDKIMDYEENSPRSITSDSSYGRGIHLASGHQEQWLIEHQIQPRQTDLKEFVHKQVSLASQSVKTAESKKNEMPYLHKEEINPESQFARQCRSSQSPVGTIPTLCEAQHQTPTHKIPGGPCYAKESIHPAAGEHLILNTPSNNNISAMESTDNKLSRSNRSSASISKPPTSPKENPMMVPMLDIQQSLPVKSSQLSVDQQYSQRSLSAQSSATKDMRLESHRSLQSHESIKTSGDKIASSPIGENTKVGSISSFINEKFEGPRSVSFVESNPVLSAEKNYEDRLRQMKQNDINSFPTSNIQALSSRLSETLAEAERVMRRCQTSVSNCSSSSPKQSYSGQVSEIRNSGGETNRSTLSRGATEIEQASAGSTIDKERSKTEQEQDGQERVVLPAEKILALLANIRKEREGKDKKM